MLTLTLSVNGPVRHARQQWIGQTVSAKYICSHSRCQAGAALEIYLNTPEYSQNIEDQWLITHSSQTVIFWTPRIWEFSFYFFKKFWRTPVHFCGATDTIVFGLMVTSTMGIIFVFLSAPVKPRHMQDSFLAHAGQFPQQNHAEN